MTQKLQPITFLTSNPLKIKTAQAVFSQYPSLQLVTQKNSYPEIQANSSLAIAKHTVLQAVHDLNQPVMREDHSFCIKALNGFPGALMSLVEKQLTAHDLLRLMADQDDRSAYFKLSLVYASPSGPNLEFTHQVPTKIMFEARGDLAHDWDRVIALKDDDRTLAEYPYEERLDLHTANYRNLAELLTT